MTSNINNSQFHFSYTGEDGEEIPVVLGDPNIPEDIRRAFFNSSALLGGQIEGNFEDIKILSPEQLAAEYLEFKRDIYPRTRGSKKAEKIFDHIKYCDGDSIYENLENLNAIINKEPIDSYVLFQLLNLVVESDRKAKSNYANKIRHIETYELRKQALDYWRTNIDTKLSNDKAAEILMKVVPVSFRKLSQYVAEAKRENIPPAR